VVLGDWCLPVCLVVCLVVLGGVFDDAYVVKSEFAASAMIIEGTASSGS
jgi:hypothetical protein